MGVVIDWIVANAAVINAVLSSSIVFALLGFLIRMLRRAWQEVHGRGRAVLVRSSRSRLVGWIEQIQERVFPPDECDPRGVLGKRIDRSRFNWLGRPKSNEAVIAIVYLKGKTPVAYLSAEYFPEIGGIFFWYIVSLRDKTLKEALSDLAIDWDEIESVKESISPRLIEKLLDVCGGARPWKYIVAEVDVEDIELARKKVGKFQYSARDVIHRWLESPLKKLLPNSSDPHPQDPRVFQLDVPFAMPLHDADLIDEAAAHESHGWLLFAPRTPEDYLVADDAYEIAGAEVRDDLLETLRLGYHTGSDEAFDDYIAKFYQRLAAGIPERVPMIHNRNVMLAPAVAAAPMEAAAGG